MYSELLLNKNDKNTIPFHEEMIDFSMWSQRNEGKMQFYGPESHELEN